MGKARAFYRKRQGLITTPHVFKLREQFKVIHPFHPLYQQEFKLINYRKSWGNEFLDYYDSEGEESD